MDDHDERHIAEGNLVFYACIAIAEFGSLHADYAMRVPAFILKSTKPSWRQPVQPTP